MIKFKYFLIFFSGIVVLLLFFDIASFNYVFTFNLLFQGPFGTSKLIVLLYYLIQLINISILSYLFLKKEWILKYLSLANIVIIFIFITAYLFATFYPLYRGIYHLLMNEHPMQLSFSNGLKILFILFLVYLIYYVSVYVKSKKRAIILIVLIVINFQFIAWFIPSTLLLIFSWGTNIGPYINTLSLTFDFTVFIDRMMNLAEIGNGTIKSRVFYALFGEFGLPFVFKYILVVYLFIGCILKSVNLFKS